MVLSLVFFIYCRLFFFDGPYLKTTSFVVLGAVVLKFATHVTFFYEICEFFLCFPAAATLVVNSALNTGNYVASLLVVVVSLFLCP